MSAQPLNTTAIVLDRVPSGDTWLRLLCFSIEHGNLSCMQRVSRKPSTAVAPVDLFDEVQFALESRSEGRTWFVREALPLKKRPGLGGSYEALRQACRFARVLARNPVPEESRAEVHALLDRALTAWEAHVRPDSVYFKSLFLLARDEGYPIRQDWWPRLDTSDRGCVDAILSEPAAAQTTSIADVARLTLALETYLHHETEIRIDA